MANVALLFAIGLPAGCGPPPSGDRDILLISIDTLRADHLGSYGYVRDTSPEIQAYFADGAIFERAYATSSFTTASMLSIFTGLLPQEHGIRLFDQLLADESTLLTQLLPKSYETAAFVSNGVLSNEGIGMGDRFDHFDDRMDRQGKPPRLERAAGPTTDAVLEWLHGRADPDRPLFLWVHYMDPHVPYESPESFAEKFDRSREGATAPLVVIGDLAGRDAAEAVEGFDAYDREIAGVDAAVGRLLRGFHELPGRDEALVILTSDHGESLAERTAWFKHADDVTEELVRVPLLLRGPGIETGRHVRLASGVDLAPTILRFAGVAVPSGMHGYDLLQARRIPEKRVVYAESIHSFERRQWRAAISADEKWVMQVSGRSAKIAAKGRRDLAADPGELELAPWNGDAPIAQGLKVLVQSDPDPAGWPAEYRKGKLMEQSLEALRALGYVE